MKAYRIRYQRKKDKIGVNEDEELLSEYSPSELSDIIAAEDMSEDEEEVAEEQEVNFDDFNFFFNFSL